MMKTREELPEEYKKVLRLIPQGSERPITVREIEQITGMSSQRIRHIVSDSIITHGILIGTSNRIGNSGYYYAIHPEEREATVKNMASRLSYLSKRIQVFKNAPDAAQMNFDFLD